MYSFEQFRVNIMSKACLHQVLDRFCKIIFFYLVDKFAGKEGGFGLAIKLFLL